VIISPALLGFFNLINFKKMITRKNKQESLLSYYNISKTERKKYPVITNILRELTPMEIKNRIKKAKEIELPIELQKWTKAYKKVGVRDDFTWKRTFRHSGLVNLSDVVLVEDQKFLQNTKFFMFMFIILLDDVADILQNKKLLNEILKIPFEEKYIEFNKLNKKEKEYLKFTVKVWKKLNKRIKACPRYKEFKEMLEYNIRQLLYGRMYGYVINKKPFLINKTECRSYLPASVCSMQVLSNFIIDFMYSDSLLTEEFGKIREVVWRAQEMTRRGNWTSGWTREIKENDFTNGVLAYAIDADIVNVNDLRKKNKEEIMRKIKNSEIEKNLLKEWEENYQEINKMIGKIKKANIKKYLSGIEKLLILVLISMHSEA